MMLDENNMRKIMDPDNIDDHSLYYIPEGMDHDLKKYFKYSKRSSQETLEPFEIAELEKKEQLMNRGLNYKFKLRDLAKYSQKLKFNDFNWKLTLSALGKEIPSEEQRERQLKKMSYIEKLRYL